MNIFRVLASGRFPMREEVVSAYLAYLLSPKMDHGLGSAMLATLLREISRHNRVTTLEGVVRQLDHWLRDDLFGDAAGSVGVELELAYPSGTSVGFIDVVIRCGEWFIAIENKIALASATQGQLRSQYTGLRQVLEQRGLAGHRVLMVYLVPAVRNGEGWSLAQSAQEELAFERVSGDEAVLVTWQPSQEHAVSFIEMLRGVLGRESRGEMPPLSYDIRQSLLAFIDFALGEFQGYPYERAVVGSRETNQRRAGDLLQTNETLFVGIQYGMAGVLRRAWRKPDFVNEHLPVSETPRGWQYLPLQDFKILAAWAMHPETQSLAGIVWNGKPFSTQQLYLVATSAGEGIFVGMRGGLDALKRLTPDVLRQSRTWEIDVQRRSSQWFSGAEFCAVLESKGVTYSRPEDAGVVDA
jgi:hypothetical protein